MTLLQYRPKLYAPISLGDLFDLGFKDSSKNKIIFLKPQLNYLHLANKNTDHR